MEAAAPHVGAGGGQGPRRPQRQRPDAEALDAEECVPNWLVCEGSEPVNGVRLATWEWQDGKYWRELPDSLWPKLELARRAGGGKVDIDLLDIDMGEADGAQQPDCRWVVDTGKLLMTHVFSELSQQVRRNTCYRAVWEWNRCDTPEEGQWVPYAKQLQRVLEDAHETGEMSVQFSVQPASGWVCKHTGTPAQLDYTVDWTETDDEDRRVYRQTDGSKRTRPARRRVCCPIPIFKLEELATVTKDGERSKAHRDFCDAIHRPGFAVVRVEPGSMPAPTQIYELWKPFFHHTPKAEKEKMAVKGSGAMSSITGSGWVGNKESAEHFEIGMKEEGKQENVPWPKTARQIDQLQRELQACCSRVCRTVTKVLEQGAEGTSDMWPQQWGNDVHSDRSKWNNLREVAWDQSLWHSFEGTVRSCQRVNFFRTTQPAHVMLRPTFGTQLHQDLGLVTVVVKGLGGGLAMHPRGTEFQYDICDWVSVERVIDEETDVVVFGGMQLEASSKEYYHAAVHGTMPPAAGPEEEQTYGTQPAEDGVRISMPLFMRVRGEGEPAKQEEEFRQDIETIVRRLLTQDAINTMGRTRLTELLESECTRTLSLNMRDAKNQDILCAQSHRIYMKYEMICNILTERRVPAQPVSEAVSDKIVASSLPTQSDAPALAPPSLVSVSVPTPSATGTIAEETSVRVASAAETSDAPDDSWTCEACTLVNQKKNAYWCAACGAPRMNTRCALTHDPFLILLRTQCRESLDPKSAVLYPYLAALDACKWSEASCRRWCRHRRT